MISIITCSVKPEFAKALTKNIEETIGIPCEIIIHNNEKSKWGICKVYNFYASKAKYDILCFIHEDVLFKTNNWGTEIINFFYNTPNIGVLGFAGGVIKTKSLSSWNGSPYRKHARINLIQTNKNQKSVEIIHNPMQEKFSRVICLDGFCMFSMKEVWKEYPFQEEVYKGFHLYDLSFSLHIATKYHNYVCHTIRIEHLSEGNFSKKWYEESTKFHELNKHILPLSVEAFSKRTIRSLDLRNEYLRARNGYYSQWEDSKLCLVKKLWANTHSVRLLLKLIFHFNIESRIRTKYKTAKKNLHR